jgi:excisionase family DNA binding protein
MKLADAAPKAGVSVKTLLRRIHAGDLKAVKSGSGRNSHWLVSERALSEYMELWGRGTREPEPEEAAS